MTFGLRILLLFLAILVAGFVLRSVKHSKMRIEDTLFWVLLSVVVLVLGILPQIGDALANVLGFSSGANFVFLFFILVLFANGYSTSRANSELETKVKELTQQIALDRLERHERRHPDDWRDGSAG